MHKSLIILVFLLTACDADKLNRQAAKFNRGVMETVDDVSSGKGLSTENLTKSVTKKATNLKEATDSIEELNQAYKDTKNGIKDAKRQAIDTKNSIQNSARRVARKMPRSSREANQMVVAYGQKYMNFFRQRMRGVSKRFQMRRGSSGGSTSSPKRHTPRRNNGGRRR